MSAPSDALKRLEQGIESITSDEGFQQWLRTLSSFPSYSWRNVVMIYDQRPDAKAVAGYRAWQTKFSRSVKKGAKSIHIFAPMMVTEEDEYGNKERKLKGFKLVPVFDIADTEGEPLPEGPEEIFLKGSSEPAQRLLPLLKGLLVRHNLYYDRKDIAPTRGSFAPMKRLIVTDENLELDMETKVLTHELVHYLAGHGEKMSEYQMNRDELEAVTEGVTFVVLDRFGMDTSDASFSYVAHWAKSPELIHRNLELIQKLSNYVVSQIESEICDVYTVPEREDQKVAA